MPENQPTDIKGVYTIADIDKWNIARIENAKTSYLMNLTEFSDKDAISQLQNLLATMQSIIEKYFSKDIITKNTRKINDREYNFYQLKEIVDNLKPSPNKRILQLIAENTFNIYNHYARIIGVEIPTTKLSKKKS